MTTRSRRFVSCVVLLMLTGVAAAGPTEDRAMADKLLATHRYDEAQRILEKLAGQLEGEAQAEARYQSANALHRQYKKDEAIEQYQQVIDHPDATGELRGVAQMNIGLCHQLSRRFDEALEAYARVKTIEGATGDAIANAMIYAGHTLNKLDRPDDAIASYESSLEYDVKFKATHQNALTAAGNVLQRQQRYAEAAKKYERALAMGEKGAYGELAANRLKECQAATGADDAFYLTPYVSRVSDTEASVFWVSREGADPGKLTVRGGGDTIEAAATLKRIADRDAYRQTVRLTGLKPYTLYEYEAKVGDKTAEGAFHTCRAEPGPTRFVVLGDTQTGWQYHTELAKRIADENPDFVLHVGDCVERGDRWDEWKVQLFDPAKPYAAKAPIWVARGNHDGGPYFQTLFGLDDQPFTSFTFGHVRVMLIDSQFHIYNRPTNPQYPWLEEQLKSLDPQGWSILCMHHSMFHTATGDRLAGQDNFRPLVEQHPPDFVLNGHYHKYSRQLPMGLPGQKPLVNIVTGGGGGRHGTPDTPSPLVEKAQGCYHYLLFEIDGNTAKVTARDIDGQTVDTYELVKDDEGMFQPEVMAKTITPELARAVQSVYAELKYPHYNRVDMTGAFDGSRVVLDTHTLIREKLPEGATLVVEAAGDTAWTVEHQSIDLFADKLAFNATPPEGADIRRGLTINVTLKVGDRLLEPRTFPVTLRVPEAK